MVTVKTGDMFKSAAQTWVNTVNCVGIMGKGVALGFKERFPDMFKDYVRRCEAHQVKLGQPYLYKRVVAPWILNFPTKDHWRSVSRLGDIVEGLRYVETNFREWGIESLAVPPLGCGQGQLEWKVVGPTLYRHLKRLEIPVELYAPFDTPHEELSPGFLDDYQVSPSEVAPQTRVRPGWVAVVGILDRLDREPYHWPVGRTTFQKIAYFATEAGIPTGLRFAQGSYGPHAADLKRQITTLVNNGLIREEQLGRMFSIRVGPTFADAEKSYAQVLSDWESWIDKIADLFMRMNTQQAETAASVHFAAHHLTKRDNAPSEKEIVEAVMQWKIRRRPPLDPKEVAVTTRHLNLLSWLSARVDEDLLAPNEEAMYA
jgi:uncharacterized protein YwgA/O-acetyl-ADP-ribose deacetylase (regulator of RNase III)